MQVSYMCCVLKKKTLFGCILTKLVLNSTFRVQCKSPEPLIGTEITMLERRSLINLRQCYGYRTITTWICNGKSLCAMMF